MVAVACFALTSMPASSILFMTSSHAHDAFVVLQPCCKACANCEEPLLLMQVTRKKNIVFEGTLTSLRRVKEIVKSVDHGNECGVGCKDFIGWEDGDKIDAFELTRRRRRLDDKMEARKAPTVSDEFADENFGELPY